MGKGNMKPYRLVYSCGLVYLFNCEDMTVTLLNEKDERLLREKKQLEKEDQIRLGLLWNQGTTKKKEPVISITSLSLFLTQSCNLHCVYCYGEGGTYGAKGNMEETTAFLGVDWLILKSGKMKRLRISFFGGEPFLQFSLMKATVLYAKKRIREAGKVVDFEVITNGTLLDEARIAFIKEEDIAVQISFDGPKELQDTQRPYVHGGKTYEDTVPKIQRLLEVCPDTKSHAVIVGDTDPKRVRRALEEIGFRKIATRLASKSLFADTGLHGFALRDTRGCLRALEEQSAEWSYGIKERDLSLLMRLKEESELYPPILSLLHNTRYRYPCSAGIGLVALCVKGDIYPCHRFVGQKEYKLGSVFGGELDVDSYRESPTLGNASCSACFAKYYCAGGCRHDHLGVTGSSSIPAKEICALRRKELELAIPIVGGLSKEDRAFLLEGEIVPRRSCPLDF